MNKKQVSEAKISQFPRIYRRITEDSNFSHLFKILRKMAIVFIFVSLLTLILFTAFDLSRNYSQNQQLQTERQKLTHEINLWKSFADKYKNYKEVYFQIAVRQYELGDYQQASQFLQKALFIDPNYTDALKLQKELGSK